MGMVKKLFYNALIVQIVAGIVGVIGMVVDGAITGNCLGTEAMAAYGFATPIVTIFVACASVFELGASILVGKLVGARKMNEASIALSSCLAFAIVFSLVLTGIIYSFAPQIAELLGARGDISQMAAEYIRGFSLCAPALFVMMVLMPVMQINGRKNLVMIAVVLMTAVNITGDIIVGLVIHGTLFGMALATTISYFVAVTILLFSLVKGSVLKISFKNISIKNIGEMIVGGSPDACQQVLRSLLIFAFNNLLLKIADSNSVAIFTAIFSAANLCMALGSGIASSTSMLTGVFRGEQDEVAIKELVKVAVTKCIIYNSVMFVILFLCSGVIMPLFITDASLIDLAIIGFRLYCLSMISYSIKVTSRAYYQAMGMTGVSYLFLIINSFIFTIIAGFGLGYTIGVNGVWLSFLVGDTLSIVVLLIYVLIKTDGKTSFLERFLFIPDDFSSDVLSRFDAISTSSEELVKVSEQIRIFCKTNGATLKTSNVLALSTEEIGEYILLNNDKNSKKELVDVRVLNKKDGWSLRIRDNGKRINPLDIINENKTDDFSYFGLKMIVDMVGNIEYVDTLNLNNLIMEISK